MDYMVNRWNPTPRPIEYTEKKEFDNFAHNVRHDLAKIVDFINTEVEPDVNHMRVDLDEAMHRIDVLARHVYELQHEVRELREKKSCAPVTKKRLRVTVCAGKDKVQIIRND